MRFKRSVAIISDTHVGSSYAVFPEVYETQEGNVVKANRIQKEIFRYYTDVLLKVYEEFKVDTVLHLGDAIEGLNRKQPAEFLTLSNLEEQKECCINLLKPLVEGRQFFILSGSYYHGSLDTKVHKGIAERLGGVYLGYMANLKLKGTTKVLNVAHTLPSSFIYRSTILDREATLLKEAEALKKFPRVDVVIRGHLHFFEHIHLPKMHIVVAPGMKAYDPSYTQMLKMMGRKIPDIGGALLLVDMKDRVIVHHFLMETPDIFEIRDL